MIQFDCLGFYALETLHTYAHFISACRDFLKLFKLPKPQNCEWCLYEKEHEYLTSLEGVEAKPKEYFETCPRYFNL